MLFETLLSLYGNFKENLFVRTWAITFFYDSPMSLFTTKLLREKLDIFGAFILKEPNQDIFVHSWCRSRTFFLVDPRWKACFAPTPSVGVVQIFGGVYVILVLKA